MCPHPRKNSPAPIVALLAALFLLLSARPDEARAQTYVYGDTITTILRPILGTPTILLQGDTLEVWARADEDTVHLWDAMLEFHDLSIHLQRYKADYIPRLRRFHLEFLLPPDIPCELYDLHLWTDTGLDDVAERCVSVIDEYPSNFYFLHVTDTHLPTHIFYDDPGWDTDNSEVVDFNKIIADINIIRPAFVLHTGDLVNSGELEEFGNVGSFKRAQNLIKKIDVPVFVVAGNHDVGGWGDIPPPQGTSRRNWWRYFGWPFLDDPPPGVASPTHDYTFDFGPFRFFGLESYENYDDFRTGIYGECSFISEQLVWLNQQLDVTPPAMRRVLFYHFDFSSQLNLAGLGVDMALWGHNHDVPEGDLTTPPYNLGLRQAADDQRYYRLIRASADTLAPEPMTQAGPNDGDLYLSYIPNNSGNATTVAATVTNQTDFDYQNGMVVIKLKNDGTTVYQVNRGTIKQRMIVDNQVWLYVQHEFPSRRTIQIIASPNTSVGTRDEAVPAAPVLDPPTPNPFNPATRISFELSRAADVLITAYNIRGQRVARVAERRYPAGRHRLLWDGRDERGRELPSGVYLLRLEAGGEESHQQAVIVR